MGRGKEDNETGRIAVLVVHRPGSRAKSFAILREPCLLIECDIFELKEVYVRFDLSLRDCRPLYIYIYMYTIRNLSYVAGE